MKIRVVFSVLLAGWFLLLFQTCAASSVHAIKKQHAQTVEVVMFTTKPSCAPKEVIERANAIMPTLKSYPGFLSRTFSESVQESNKWIDIVRWASLHDALLAAKKITKVTAMKKFISLMTAYKMYHYSVKLEVVQ